METRREPFEPWRDARVEAKAVTPEPKNSVWEIHPVYAIVCAGKIDQFVPCDSDWEALDVWFTSRRRVSVSGFTDLLTER